MPEVILHGSALLFAFAILHIFMAPFLAGQAERLRDGSFWARALHIFGEIELVFGIWSFVFIVFMAMASSPGEVAAYLKSRHYAEPLFVFVIMTVCATRPVLSLVEKILSRSRRDDVAFFVIMILGPLLGSLITEPAAMTVCALLLLPRFYQRTNDLGFKYAMTGLLFVNISIGGTLTSFAAPPVLMVAGVWNWDSAFMLAHFGWKAVIAICLSTVWIFVRYRRVVRRLSAAGSSGLAEKGAPGKTPWWLTIVHVAFVAAIVVFAHQPLVFMGLFTAFIAVVWGTRRYQEPLKYREGLLVGVFLAGLVVLGGLQGWWLEPLLSRLTDFSLFTGAIGLTALTDNAALTYLGSLVPSLSEASKYALVAGAVVGGGLTVIANAPNPAGYGILNGAGIFGGNGFSARRLFIAALGPTLIAALCFWLL